MFLNYRIYRLENKIKDISTRHHNISSGIREEDEDAQAYLKLLDSKIFHLNKRLDILKAKRYRQKLKHVPPV